jgi:diguanylate cyclase (GGDEF)-like protein
MFPRTETMSTSTLQPRVHPARNDALLIGLPLAATYAMVVVAFLAVRNLGSRWVLSEIAVLAVATLATITAAVQASRSTSNRFGWALLAGSALASSLSHLFWAFGSESLGPLWLLLVSNVTFTVAAASVFVNDVRGDGLELGFDTALIISCAVLVAGRWAPSARETLLGHASAAPALLVASASASVAGVAFTLIGATVVSGATLLALSGAALSFALATLPLSFVGGTCCGEGNPFALAAVLGWLFVSYGALRTPEPPLLRSSAGWSGRDVVPIAGSVLVAIVLLDFARGAVLPTALAFVLGVTVFLLGARLAQLVSSARRHRAEHQELAHSRALVQVSKALSDTTDLDAILGVVIELACRLLPAKGAGVELFAQGAQTLELRAAGGVAGSLDPHLLHGPAAVKARLTHRDTDLGVLSCIADRPFTLADRELLGALADQAAVAIENARLFKQVHEFSLTDPLTGLSNRRHLEREIAREFAAARRGRRLMAVMFDLNGFKDYNDKYGHVAGDEALRVFADTLRTETRAMNAAARYGGDEFFVLVGDSDPFGAQVFVVRVKQRFSRAIAALGRGQLSVSAGIAEFRVEMIRPEELIDAADRALYESKSSLRASM